MQSSKIPGRLSVDSNTLRSLHSPTDELDRHPARKSRRAFMQVFGLGIAACTLNACGSGSGSLGGAFAPSNSANADAEPLWASIPALTFTEGVAARISIASYVTDSDSVSITKNSVALPAGVTYDAPTKSFVYDGVGGVSTTDGHVLTATKG
jgi:hypothetical protein